MKHYNSFKLRIRPCKKRYSTKKKNCNSPPEQTRPCVKDSNKAISALESQYEQIKAFEGLIVSQQERLKMLDGQQAKHSYDSSLPPSSDRFILSRACGTKSGRKLGEQKDARSPALRGQHRDLCQNLSSTVSRSRVALVKAKVIHAEP
jgi:hypothetical protein